VTTNDVHSRTEPAPARAIAEAPGSRPGHAPALALSDAGELPLDRIIENPNDHRRDGADSQEDQELTESICARGVLQPVIVWEDAEGCHLVAGHRRCRCARRAGLTTVPVRKLSRKPSDHEITIIALQENAQRKNISDVEFGMACLELLPAYGTASEIAKVLHKSVSTVTRAIALVEKLPADIRAQVGPGGLPPSVARVLTGLPDDEAKRRFAAMYGKSIKTGEELAAAIKAARNGNGQASTVTNFTFRHAGVSIAVTVADSVRPTDVEAACRQLAGELKKHGTAGWQHFTQYLEAKARATKKAAELQQAQNALDAHVRPPTSSPGGAGGESRE
jgi:ParB family chromosome partitioning protein